MTLPNGLRNPFLGTIVDDPWRAASVSVPAIHAGILGRCQSAMEFVRREDKSAGVLIHGQPGSGKTHLLSRLREYAAKGMEEFRLDAERCVFVSVRLSTSPQRIWRYVRQCFVDDLLRRLPNGSTQLEQVIASRLAKEVHQEGDLSLWWDYMLQEEQAERLKEHIEDWVVEAKGHNALSKILLQLLRKHNRLAARAWLRGEMLPDSDLELLGLPLAQEDAELDLSAETESREIVLALCRLIGPGVPIIFCFDQVEGLQHVTDDNAGIGQFGQMIADLHDGTFNAVLISCIQANYLKIVREAVDRFAMDRVHSYMASALAPLTFDEASDLVAARLGTLADVNSLRPRNADRLWPLTAQGIKQVVGQAGCTPRELISFCANRFTELQGGKVLDKRPRDLLPEIWEERIDAAAKHNKPDQTEHILADGLPLLVALARAGQGFKVQPSSGLRDVDFVIAGPDGEEIGVSFCTQANMTSLAGRLRRLHQSDSWNRFHRRVVLRDVRTPISKNARQVRNYLTSLENGGAIVYRPTAEVMAALDALRRLLTDADSGDLAIDGKTMSQATVEDWLRENLAASLEEAAGAILGDTVSEFHDMSFEEPGFDWDQLTELLCDRHVLTVEDAASALNRPKEHIEHAVKAHPELAGFLEGPPGVLFEVVEAEASETGLFG